MRKIIALFLILSTLTAALCACKNHEDENGEYVFNYGEGTASEPALFFRKVAREVQKDGWVYSFVYEGMKDEKADDNLIHYSFFGFNIRYKYDENYIQKNVRYPESPDKGEIITEITYPSALIAGRGPAAESRDIALINNDILDSGRSVEELLALDPDDYEFESIDRELFFRLMRTALTGEWQKEGTDQAYWDKPTFALLIEPEYLSGYKFQVAFLNETGCVDEMYIDILYQTGKGYTDYVQLSDLVENGTATTEQAEAFEKIREIAENIKEQDSYFANAEDWRNLEIGGIDFSRLYTFFDRLYWNDYSNYREDMRIETIKGEV